MSLPYLTGGQPLSLAMAPVPACKTITKERRFLDLSLSVEFVIRVLGLRFMEICSAIYSNIQTGGILQLRRRAVMQSRIWMCHFLAVVLAGSVLRFLASLEE